MVTDSALNFEPPPKSNILPQSDVLSTRGERGEPCRSGTKIQRFHEVYNIDEQYFVILRHLKSDYC